MKNLALIVSMVISLASIGLTIINIHNRVQTDRQLEIQFEQIQRRHRVCAELPHGVISCHFEYSDIVRRHGMHSLGY